MASLTTSRKVDSGKSQTGDLMLDIGGAEGLIGLTVGLQAKFSGSTCNQILGMLFNEPAPAATKADLDPAARRARRRAVEELGIEILGKGKISVVLNRTSRAEFLEKADSLITRIYGRSVLDSSTLARLSQTSRAKVRTSEVVRVDGNVRNSTDMSEAELKAGKLNDVAACDLAVAHLAYFLATGKDLFGGNAVRAHGGDVLNFSCYGMLVNNFLDLFGDYLTAASRLLPRRK